MLEIRVNDVDLAAVRELWREYWSDLGMSPDFDGFEEELQSLPGKYGPPGGGLLLALVDDEPAGAVGLRALSQDACEAKRLYVRPEFRGKGLGRALMERVIGYAGTGGFQILYANTLPSMTEALPLYRKLGFKILDGPYAGIHLPDAIYLERRLP